MRPRTPHTALRTPHLASLAIAASAGAVLGAIVGGGLGQVISQGTQFGLGTAFLRFSREYERDADIEGAQIMARAGYDPNDMANMFKTIQHEEDRTDRNGSATIPIQAIDPPTSRVRRSPCRSRTRSAEHESSLRCSRT